MVESASTEEADKGLVVHALLVVELVAALLDASAQPGAHLFVERRRMVLGVFTNPFFTSFGQKHKLRFRSGVLPDLSHRPRLARLVQRHQPGQMKALPAREREERREVPLEPSEFKQEVNCCLPK